jgi:hypothetical protein
MGSSFSSLKYHNIVEIIDLVSIKDPNKFMHVIKFEDGKEKTIKLNKKQEYTFQLRYKYTNMLKEIRKLKYNSITNIIRKEIDQNQYNMLNKYVISKEDNYIYNLKIILDDGNIQSLNVNKLQYDLFCKINNRVNKIKISNK